MKKLLTLALSILTFGSYAQLINIHGNQFSVKTLSEKLISEIRATKKTPTAKTNTLKQRLIGESVYNLTLTNPSLTDSGKYIYSGNNGSNYRPGMQYYNNAYPPMFMIGGDEGSYSKINICGDTMYRFGFDASQNFVPITKTYASFNADKKVHFFESWDQVNQDTIQLYNLYNSAGNITTMLTLRIDYNTMQFDSSEKRVLVYDNQGRIIRDTVFSYDLGDWNVELISRHQFNTSGNEIKTSFDYNVGAFLLTVFTVDMTYYSNNKLKTMLFKAFNGSSLTNNQRDTMGYTGTAEYPTYDMVYRWNDTTSVWVAQSLTLKNVNSLNLADTINISTWDYSNSTLNLSNLYTLKFNSYNNPTETDFFDLNSGNPVISNKHYFFYQDYNDLGLNDIDSGNDVIIYPNPTQNDLFIDTKNNATNTLEIVDIMGNIIQQTTFNGKTVIDMSSMPTGMYHVSIYNKEHSLLKTKSILKN